jgi:hypothetical protein
VTPDLFRRALSEWMETGAKVLALVSDDEDLVDRLVVEVVEERQGGPVAFWSSASGLSAGDGNPAGSLTRDVGHLFSTVARMGDGVVVAHDLGAELSRPAEWRALYEMDGARTGPVLCLTRRPGDPWPAALDWVPTLTVRPPEAPGLPVSGLSGRQRERVWRLTPPVRAEWVRTRLGGTPGLMAVPSPPDFTRVGGLSGLKGWVARRRLAFQPGSTLPRPRGLLFFGVQGTGKSLAAQALAPAFGVPLWRLDFGSLFGRFVGESEGRLRQLLQSLEEMGPAVLWMDEVDKALAGGVGGADADAGTSARLLGGFLTWLATRPGDQVVVAVANRIDALPPELLRAGRFDDWFFFDLPDMGDRREILRLYVPDDMAEETVDALAAMTAGFTGADLAQVAVEAQFLAAAAGRSPTARDLTDAAREVVPFSRRFPDRVDALRAMAEGRARRA